ncbi:alpha/beta fold hydrolase [Micromonospora globbae]|uniref:alpha/beta fold hydrolase n=1 Tax=Micromonospora globbae TaxID=1894969 RepID=UPI0038630263|nr:alpha/beta hydrolase [Micromonospora globbae]
MPPVMSPATSYVRTVRGTGPGLLLAHGASGGVAANYGPLLDTLAADHTVVGVDYPGSGDTPRAGAPLVLDDLADQLVAAADEQGLDRFAVLGYSLGSAVAVRVASRYPARVAALVLTAPFARPNTRLRLAAEQVRDLQARGEMFLLARHTLPLALGADALEALSPDEVQDVLRTSATTAPPGGGDQMDLVTRVDVRDDLSRITARTLVISTTADLLVTPDLHRDVAAAIPGAELVEIPTGHLPFLEDPTAWEAAITRFLATTS